MLATQVLLNNLFYDGSQFALPLDNVDDGEIRQPHTLSLRQIEQFMWSYGLLSSFFDFSTFGLLLWVFHADQPLFQAGWFLESIFTQVLVVYIIRTRLRPFRDSRPAPALIFSTLTIVLLAAAVVLLPIRHIFHFGILHPGQLLGLGGVVVAYLLCAELIKGRFYGSGRASGRRAA